MTSKCHKDCPKLASIIAAEKIVEPMSEINLGEKRFAQATTNGAPMVMREMDMVPMRSINAGDAPVNGVSGCCESVSNTAWKMPKAKLMPQQVNTIVKEAMVMMMVCLLKELRTAFLAMGGVVVTDLQTKLTTEHMNSRSIPIRRLRIGSICMLGCGFFFCS